MLALALSLAALLPQGEQDRPTGLTVIMVNVGQGDGIVLRAPDGTIHVVDAGPDGEGTAAMLPAIVGLQPTGYGFTFLTHFHDDHQGGMDEVLQRPFLLAYDRGDVRRTNTSSSTTNYLNAAGVRRRSITVGSVYQLGGGASVRCIAANGDVWGGAHVDTTTSAQEENSRSMVLRLDYKDFSMWLGGDLTGGASSTSDVEGPAGLACGDVDVYKVDHHGSNTSTSTNLVSRIDPELAIVSAGVGNSYGHPTGTVTNRLNQAAAARALLCTTSGAASIIGFAACGNIRIDTDGERYRVTAQNGDCLDFYVDEIASANAQGALRIGEVQRNPNRVPDTNGEYLEVTNTGPRPIGLKGMRLSSNSSTITIQSNLMLVPGRPVLFEVDAVASRNGGLPFGLPLPWQTLSLGDTGDSISLQQGASTVDQLTYGTSLPGGVGIAAERRDLLGGTTASNFAPAVTPYGQGDLGSPGRRNDADSTVYPVQVDVATAPDAIVLRGSALGAGGKFSVLALSFTASSGFPLWNGHVPLDFDWLLQGSLGFSGALAVLPAEGYRSLRLSVPNPSPLHGLTLHAAHVVFDLNTLTLTGVSPAIAFQAP